MAVAQGRPLSTVLAASPQSAYVGLKSPGSAATGSAVAPTPRASTRPQMTDTLRQVTRRDRFVVCAPASMPRRVTAASPVSPTSTETLLAGPDPWNSPSTCGDSPRAPETSGAVDE